MGELQPHRGARGLRGREALIAWALALALGGEIAIPSLEPGQLLQVEGRVYDGTEARGLSGGNLSVRVLRANGETVLRRSVLLNDDERVVLDLEQRINPEVWRGPIPERDEEAESAASPQLLVVGAVEWQRVRVHLDGRRLPFDPDTRTFREVLQPGPHRLDRMVAGRGRPPVVLDVGEHPWHCAVERDGAMSCVEWTGGTGAARPADDVLEELERMPASRRVPWLLDQEAPVSCGDIATWMQILHGDGERVALALGLRGRVVDPWNHAQLTRPLSFSESQRRVEALYRGTSEVRVPVLPAPDADGELPQGGPADR